MQMSKIDEMLGSQVNIIRKKKVDAKNEFEKNEILEKYFNALMFGICDVVKYSKLIKYIENHNEFILECLDELKKMVETNCGDIDP